MSKITYVNKKGKITITNRLAYPEAVNERVYNALMTGMFDGFLPITVIQKRKETRVECRVQEMVLASNYFGGVVTKRMFLDFVLQIIDIIKKCERNMINANNIELEMDKIFIEPRTKKVNCIYWPLVNNHRDNPPHLFLKDLPFKMEFNLHEDQEYLRRYQAFFDGTTPFSINNFEKLIMKMQGKKISGGHALSETLHEEGKPVKKEEKEVKKSSIEYDPFAELGGESEEQDKAKEIKTPRETSIKVTCCPKCGVENEQGANFCYICGADLHKKKKIEVSKGTTVLGAESEDTAVLDDDDFGTTVLSYDEPEEPVYPILLQVRTEDEFVIDIDLFRMGKKEGECDCAIPDNKYISKHHADIITRLDRYYIIDRGSTNKTFVDGKKIEPETEVELFHGTSIRLANEDFIFNIEK